MTILCWYAVAAVLVLLAALPARADGDAVVLSDDTRSILSSLDAISGPAVTIEGLDDKVVVVPFFASWCPPCHTEFEHLNEIYETYHEQGVEIVAVNAFEFQGGFNDGGVRLAAFVEDFDPAFSLVAGDDAVRQAFGNVRRIPTVFVFDRTGQSTLHFIHIRDAEKTNPTAEEVDAAIRTALGLS